MTLKHSDIFHIVIALRDYKSSLIISFIEQYLELVMKYFGQN